MVDLALEQGMRSISYYSLCETTKPLVEPEIVSACVGATSKELFGATQSFWCCEAGTGFSILMVWAWHLTSAVREGGQVDGDKQEGSVKERE